jgi:hypothetical protein
MFKISQLLTQTIRLIVSLKTGLSGSVKKPPPSLLSGVIAVSLSSLQGVRYWRVVVFSHSIRKSQTQKIGTFLVSKMIQLITSLG